MAPLQPVTASRWLIIRFLIDILLGVIVLLFPYTLQPLDPWWAELDNMDIPVMFQGGIGDHVLDIVSSLFYRFGTLNLWTALWWYHFAMQSLPANDGTCIGLPVPSSLGLSAGGRGVHRDCTSAEAISLGSLVDE